MAGSDGSLHEQIRGEAPPPASSDRSFGLLFAAVCGVLTAIAVWEGRPAAIWWAVAALSFLALGLFAAPLLRPLNRAWRWFSLQLFRIVSPVVMSVLFFVILTPIGILMRMTGKDPLRLRFERDKPSYWLPRTAVGERQTSMTKQF